MTAHTILTVLLWVGAVEYLLGMAFFCLKLRPDRASRFGIPQMLYSVVLTLLWPVTVFILLWAKESGRI